MLVRFSTLKHLRTRLRRRPIVFAGGTFDLFHSAHVEALRRLRRFGEVVVVAVSSDMRVRERKGLSRPILSQKERVRIVEAIRHVDFALIAPEPTHRHPVPTMRILRALRPDVFVSSDVKWRDYRVAINRLGISLKIVRRAGGISTTELIHRIAQRRTRPLLPARDPKRVSVTRS
jgi:cytidyltransferase-like protein